MVERTAVFPADQHSLYAEHRYSAAIRSDDLPFASGQAGSREDRTPEPDLQQQVEPVLNNLRATPAAAGCIFDGIIDAMSLHADPGNQSGDAMTMKDEISSAPPYPNWTAVDVAWLADFDFEVKVIARIPEQ